MIALIGGIAIGLVLAFVVARVVAPVWRRSMFGRANRRPAWEPTDLAQGLPRIRAFVREHPNADVRLIDVINTAGWPERKENYRAAAAVLRSLGWDPRRVVNGKARVWRRTRIVTNARHEPVTGAP